MRRVERARPKRVTVALKLDDVAIGIGQAIMDALNIETRIVYNYFLWAGKQRE